MMNLSKIAMGLGLGLATAMTGCVIDVTDDGDDSAGVTTTPSTTTGTDTGNETPAGSDDGSTSAGSGDVSTGPAACDPACEPDQECMDGMCVLINDDTTGDPPAECGLAVQLDFPNPECGTCLAENCCDQLQTCFGDENVGMETECLTLNNCIVTNCDEAMTVMEVEECIEANCADSSDSFDDWVSYQMCLGGSCNQDCF